MLMKKRALWLVILCIALTTLTACGQKSETSQAQTTVAEKKVRVPADAGVRIIDEILITFDQCVAEAAALAKDKPEAAVLLPQLKKLYADYGVKMAALNAKFLALRDQDVFTFRQANGYMTDNRPKHVFNKDNILSQAIAFYNFEKGEQVVVDMLSNKIVKLLDEAVKQ
jgi:maltose-binding protein MalE